MQSQWPESSRLPGWPGLHSPLLGVGWGFAGITMLQGKWPWFASPCSQMKLFVRASTWHSAIVPIVPFQGADRVPFKIQAVHWWTLRMCENLHFQWKMKMPESPFYQVLNKNKFIFFMPIIICLEGAGAALRMRREDAWASSANGEGLWLDRAGGRALLGPAKTDAPWKNMVCLFLSKVLPHSTINVCALGSIRKTGQEKTQRFCLAWGPFWKGYYTPLIKLVSTQARNKQVQTRTIFST